MKYDIVNVTFIRADFLHQEDSQGCQAGERFDSCMRKEREGLLRKYTTYNIWALLSRTYFNIRVRLCWH